jgi:xyloglucan-specific exo-beta-1,4-glucanase
MVAAMNLWWPDVQIFRSNDSVRINSSLANSQTNWKKGATWTTIWDFNDGNVVKYYTYDVRLLYLFQTSAQ